MKIDQIMPNTYPFSQNITKDNLVTLTAIPAAGYRFIGWRGSLTDNDNPATTNMTCSQNITAAFAANTEFVLTVSVNGSGGTVTPEVGNHGYAEGEIVGLTAKPFKGYRFDGWTGDLAGIDSANTTITMDTPKTIAARFAPILHTLTIRIAGKGTVTPLPGDHQMIDGSISGLFATPDKDYRFDGWTGAVADAASNNTTIILDSSQIVTANFTRVSPLFPVGLIIGVAVIILGFVGGGMWWVMKKRISRHGTG